MSDMDDTISQARAKWRYRGQRRPPFAQAPAPWQASVWDYPRPPVVVGDSREVIVAAGELELARTRGAFRVLETASPPTFYLPPADVVREYLVPVRGSTFCEWKGQARYYDIVLGDGRRWPRQAWSYPAPMGAFERLAGLFAFYPGELECFVNGERVRAQPGDYYGGWVTAELVGPFKGEPATGQW